MNALAIAALRRLKHDAARSGDSLARASVAHALTQADALGVPVLRLRGQGYRLPQPIDWLAREEILAALGSNASRFDLSVIDEIGSTNSALFDTATHGARHATCIAAELQTHGRGRRGRTWLSPLGGGLTFSLLWRFAAGAAHLSALSLAVGVAIVRTLRALGVVEVKLKWPNDVVHHLRKLGGILIELQGDILGPSAAVIGIGLNVRLDEATLNQIAQPVTDLASLLPRPPERNRLLAALLAQLADVLDHFESEGFAPLRAEWLSYHAYQDKNVRLSLPDGAGVEGRVTGVAEDGSLLLATAQGERRFTVGEIGLRRTN